MGGLRKVSIIRPIRGQDRAMCQAYEYDMIWHDMI